MDTLQAFLVLLLIYLHGVFVVYFIMVRWGKTHFNIDYDTDSGDTVRGLYTWGSNSSFYKFCAFFWPLMVEVVVVYWVYIIVNKFFDWLSKLIQK